MPVSRWATPSATNGRCSTPTRSTSPRWSGGGPRSSSAAAASSDEPGRELTILTWSVVVPVGEWRTPAHAVPHRHLRAVLLRRPADELAPHAHARAVEDLHARRELLLLRLLELALHLPARSLDGRQPALRALDPRHRPGRSTTHHPHRRGGVQH